VPGSRFSLHRFRGKLENAYEDAIIRNSSWPRKISTSNQNDFGVGWETGAYIYDESIIDRDDDGIPDNLDNCPLSAISSSWMQMGMG